MAFLAGLILTIFFVVYGPRIFLGGARADPRSAAPAARVERVLVRGTRRGLDYARIKVLEALVEGVLAYVIARAAGVPGPAALGVWVGLWTLLPVAGVFVGRAADRVLRRRRRRSTRAVVVALVFVAIGTAEFLFKPFVERETVEVGSFLIVFAAFGGLELDGLTGALLGVLGVIVLVAMFDEVGRDDGQAAAESTELLIPRRE